MLRNVLIVATALSLLAVPSASAIFVHTSTGPYGEPCAGVYFGNGQSWVLCAGKGVVTPHVTDCVVWIDFDGVHEGQCVGV